MTRCTWLASMLTIVTVLSASAKWSAAHASARTTEVVIENRTDQPLVGDSITVNHGEITKQPPKTIAPGQTGRLVADSNGIATGNEGTVRYKLPGGAGIALFHWDNPFTGTNSFDSSAPSGYATDHTIGHANHTVVFFFVRAVSQSPTTCNGAWVVSRLGTSSESSLGNLDEAVAVGSTPLKKAGIQGWVDTGCNASAVGTPVRDAQHSTDGFWTIDLRLRSFTAGDAQLDPSQPRYVRVEVEPDTPAHAHALAKAGVPVAVHGRVFIDTHHGEQLIEIHPYDPMTVASAQPNATDICLSGYVWRETSTTDHICVTPASRQRASDDNRAAASRRVANGDVCVIGYVWREAVSSDHVCVIPQTRAQTAEENRLATSRHVQ